MKTLGAPLLILIWILLGTRAFSSPPQLWIRPPIKNHVRPNVQSHLLQIVARWLILLLSHANDCTPATTSGDSSFIAQHPHNNGGDFLWLCTGRVYLRVCMILIESGATRGSWAVQISLWNTDLTNKTNLGKKKGRQGWMFDEKMAK